MMETYTNIGITPQYPCRGFYLQRLKFWPVQPYGLIWAKETQFNRQLELNTKIKELEKDLEKSANEL